MKPRFVSEVLKDDKALQLRARATFYDVDFEIYAFRDLSQDEVARVIAVYIMGNGGGLVKGARYKVVSEIGNDD